jgi:hypothetical protein
MWKVMIEKQSEKKVKLLRTDNGMELCSNQFNNYCSNQGIDRNHAIPFTPQQNGVTKRMNRTIISKARCMLSNAGMSKCFWAAATSRTCYLINKSPSIPLDKKTPIEVWSRTPTDYSHLRVLITLLIHIGNGKLDPRPIMCVFLGYGLGVKAYRLWNPNIKRILMSSNVVFNEAVIFTDSQISVDSDASDDELQRVSM